VVVAAISFVTPAMLAGMALAGLPLAAHLLTRRTRRRIVFPTVRLLHESAASTSRLYRMRRWLLLALRCAAVFLVAWAFARPVWLERSAAPGELGRGAGVAVVLDTSASVAQQAEGVSLVQSMRAMADRVLDSLARGKDRAGIIYACARPHAALPELSPNLDILRQELSGLRATSERADFAEAIAQAGEMLKRHDGQRRLVVLSDMQRSNWSEVTLRGAAALPRGTVVTILPVGREAAGNVSLSAPRAMPARPVAGQEVQLVVQVGNYGPSDRDVDVQVSIDGRPAGTAAARGLKPFATREVEFRTKLGEVGEHRVVFSVPPDALSGDDAAYLTVPAVRRVPVVVAGDDNPNQPGTGSYFMVRALAPRGDMGDDLEVRHLTGADLTYAQIADAEAVFLGQVGRLSDEALKSLHMYATQGGGVAICCGEGPVFENLLALRNVTRQQDILAWTPAGLRDLARDGGFLLLGEGRWQGAPLADFDETSREALRHVRFFRVWATGALDKGAADLLRFADGTPAVAARPVGAGKLVFCNFSPALRCSDLGKHGSFVALMHAMFHYLRADRGAAASAVPGEPFGLPVTVPAGGQVRLEAFGPDGRPCQIDGADRAEAARALVRFRRPALAGFYEVHVNGRLAASAAANLDPREGDLRRIDADTLRKDLAAPGVALEVQGADQAGPVLRLQGTPLWPWFVLGAMAAIALELTLVAIWKR